MDFRLVLMVAGLALVACSPQPAETTSDAAKASEGAAKPAQIAAGQVRLAGDNITITGPAGTTLAFGSPRDVVDTELARAMGPAFDRSSIDECGAGPMEFTDYSGGLRANFQDSKLVGWTLSREEDESSVMTTMNVGVGTSEQDVKKAYSVQQMTDSTLGDEFYTSDGVGGFFTSNGSGKVVESLFAGTNCFFR